MAPAWYYFPENFKCTSMLWKNPSILQTWWLRFADPSRSTVHESPKDHWITGTINYWILVSWKHLNSNKVLSYLNLWTYITETIPCLQRKSHFLFIDKDTTSCNEPISFSFDKTGKYGLQVPLYYIGIKIMR